MNQLTLVPGSDPPPESEAQPKTEETPIERIERKIDRLDERLARVERNQTQHKSDLQADIENINGLLPASLRTKGQWVAITVVFILTIASTAQSFLHH